MSFVHLSVHTDYSLHDSIVRVKPLMAAVADAGMPAVAVTDDSNIFCAIKAYRAAMSQGIKPIIGSHLRIGTSRLESVPMTFLAKNNAGYKALTQIISRGYDESLRDDKDRPIIPLEWFRGHGNDIIALSGGREGEIGRFLLSRRDAMASEALEEYRSIFGQNFFIELQRIGHPADDNCVEKSVNLAINAEVPVVATNPVRFMRPDEFSSHDIRLAIAQGKPAQRLREEIDIHYTPHMYLKSPEEMKDLFSDIPEAIENTVRIAAQCNVDITLGKSFLPSFPVPEGMTEADYLRAKSREGLEKRLKFYFGSDEEIEKHRQEYEQRLEFELNTISDMGFPGYFLIVADFIQWAKNNDIPVGPGRGSGAGSLVAYALEITDLNPIPYALLFERFLNPERVSMPDFDIDFCMDKRDRVIQYVADTYGHHAVSQIITYGTMAAKMVVKDVARALSHPYRLGDSISRLIPSTPGITLREAYEQSPELQMLVRSDSDVNTIWSHALTLEGLTRQVGKHAGGVLIAPGALTDFTATYKDPDGGGLVSQYDKDDVEAAGLVKFDFLGLRNLTIIDHALKSINERRQKSNQDKINILGIGLDDRKTYELLQRCETTAVFQLESSGMKNLIKRLQPDCFEDIVALVALFRPGPLQSGMVDDFVDRKHGRAEVTYAHPCLEPILNMTYGVIVYQEQVMQIAQVMAGYTLGGADMLRRAMGKKKPEEMAKQRAIFLKGAQENNIEPEIAEATFDLMEKFAAYGFNKSHSAAYALIAYQTAWLKAHYPADFMAAVLSSDMDNTDKVVRFIHECRSMNIDINPPDINLSKWSFTSDGDKIIYGLGAIKGLGENAAKGILEERGNHGEYQNMVDFLYRNPLNKRISEACINAGLFDSEGKTRAEQLAVYPLALAAGKQLKKQQGQGMLFDMEIPDVPRKHMPEMEEDIRLSGERRVLGLYLTGHPYHKYRESLAEAMTADLSKILNNVEDETTDKQDRYYRVTVAGLMTDIDIRSNTKGNSAFFKLDDGTARVDCVIYNKEYHEYQAFVRDDNLVVLDCNVHLDSKTGNVRFRVNNVQPLDTYLDNQNGRVVIKVSDENEAKQVLSSIRELHEGDEGALRVQVQIASNNTIDAAIPPISRTGKTIDSLRKALGDKVSVFYSSTKHKPAKKSTSDIQIPETQEDLQARRAKARLELEQHLTNAERAMLQSKESSTQPEV